MLPALAEIRKLQPVRVCAILGEMKTATKPTATAKAGNPESVIQFSVFTPNRLGRLHDLIALLGTQGVHVLALMVLDTTDSSIIRFVADDPGRTRETFAKRSVSIYGKQTGRG